MNWCDILVVCTMHAWCCCIVKDNREIAANALLIVVAVTATAAKPTQAEWERQRALRLDWYSSKRGSLTLWWLTFFSHGDVVFHSRRRVLRFVFMAVKNKCVPMKKKKRRKVSHVSPSTVERSCCALSSRICQSTWLHEFSIFLFSFCYFLLSNSIYSITFFYPRRERWKHDWICTSDTLKCSIILRHEMWEFRFYITNTIKHRCCTIPILFENQIANHVHGQRCQYKNIGFEVQNIEFANLPERQ